MFDSTLQRTHIWLDEICDKLGWNDRHKAYHALRVVLHALRDRLQVNEAVDLAAQPPMLVRAFYFEGLRSTGKPLKERKLAQFLMHITDAFLFDVAADSREIAGAVFHVLAWHVSPSEIDGVKRALPGFRFAPCSESIDLARESGVHVGCDGELPEVLVDGLRYLGGSAERRVCGATAIRAWKSATSSANRSISAAVS